eukprot:456488_1
MQSQSSMDPNQPLPAGWREVRTDDGQVYYQNDTTQTTQWEFPTITNSSQPQQPLPAGWREVRTDDGQVYYQNDTTQATQWEIPTTANTTDSIKPQQHPPSDANANDPKHEALLVRIKELEREVDALRAKGNVNVSGRVPYTIASDVKKYIVRSKTGSLQKLVQEKQLTANDTLLIEIGEFFLNDVNENETTKTLLEYAALHGVYEICALLINLGATQPEEELDQLFDDVIKEGHYHIALLISFMQLRGGGGSEVADISMRVDRQNGILKEMLYGITDTVGDEKTWIFIDIIEQNIIHCIQNEIGFSDDFLNTLYFYYTKIVQQPFIETDLFAVIREKCKQIIENKNTKNWYFFKTYIMASTIWFRDGKSIGWIDYFDGARALNDEEEEEADGASGDDGQDVEENDENVNEEEADGASGDDGQDAEENDENVDEEEADGASGDDGQGAEENEEDKHEEDEDADGHYIVYECKHELKPFKPKDQFCCSECEKASAENDTFYGCRECDYDRCAQCFVDKKDEPRILKDGPPPAYLFYELLKIVNDGFEAKIAAKLQKPFKEIAEQNPDDWKALCSYDIVSTLESQCRQDLVPNGIKGEYTHSELTQYVPSSASFNAYSHYDINEYLSKLLLTAHTVDDEFHKSIQMIFQIDLQKNNQSAIKELNNMEYSRGPVKLIARCQAKAETDYADEPYPSSACILDINRCALIFNDIGSMLNGLNLFENKVSYFQSGNIVAICRDKNGFAIYSHDKPDYADVKFNVLIKGVKYNIIGEVQFMLRQMMNFKHSVHSLYSIIRRKEFVDDCIKLLPYKVDPAMRMKSAAAMVDYNVLCDLMVTHGFGEVELLSPVTDVGTTILTSIFENLHFKSKEKAAVRCFKLLVDNSPKDVVIEKLLEGDGMRAMGHYETMKFIFSQFPEYEAEIREDESLKEMCALMLTLYPEPQQFINCVNILHIGKPKIDEWIHDPAVLHLILMARKVDNVKYLFSLFPSKKEVLKFLNTKAPSGDTRLQQYCFLGGNTLRTLLMAFDIEDRLQLIEKGDLILLNVAIISSEMLNELGVDKKFPQSLDGIKMIIESVNEIPKEQHRLLTKNYHGCSLVELSKKLGETEFADWCNNKIDDLEATQLKP